MTREEKEETIEILKAYRDRLSNSVSNQLDKDIRAFDIAINSLEQELFMNKPCVAHQVCHEDKVKVLDKIRAEIDQLTYYWCEVNPRSVIDDVLHIIDKYKAESEDNMTDVLINLEDAIEAIAGIDITDGTEPIFSGKQVIALLKDLNTIKLQKSKWTLASEKLPEKEGKYLVTRDGIVADTVYILSYSKNLYKVNNFNFNDKKGVPGWYDYDDEWGDISFDDVIAWMPLPEPYKEDYNKCLID